MVALTCLDSTGRASEIFSTPCRTAVSWVSGLRKGKRAGSETGGPGGGFLFGGFFGRAYAPIVNFRLLSLITVFFFHVFALGAAELSVNILDREQVRAFYNAVYAASTNANSMMAGTASIATCEPGTTSAAFKELVRLRVNFYRAMAGVPANIVFDDVFNAKCQRMALMMAANNQVNHFPPATWTCYTAEGAEAAGKANLTLGNTGPVGIDAYITDRQANNAAVGHRRWILFPQTTTMGTGDVDFAAGGNQANALWVLDGRHNNPRPATRNGFVAWPPAGYMPSPIMPVRWSLSYPLANFSAANVTLSSNGVPVAVTKEPVSNGSGENTLVWFIQGMNTTVPYVWPAPAGDVTFEVTITGVSGTGIPTQFAYTVKMFDPRTVTPGAVIPMVSGPAQVTTRTPTAFTYTTPVFATGNELRTSPLRPAQADGAENLLVNFVNVSSASYSNIVTSPVNSGARAFRLGHADAMANQHLAYRPTLLPRAGAELRFASRLTRATTAETARVQVSTDGGGTWTDIFTQSGNSNPQTPVEPAYVARTLSLAPYVNRAIKLRFNYTANGSFFLATQPEVGWYFDDITFINTSELIESTVETLPMGGNFTFTTFAPGDYLLETRPEVWDEYFLEWGPGTIVTATGEAGGFVSFSGPVTLAGGNLQIIFDINGVENPVAKIFKSAAPNGPWIIDESATIEVDQANGWFRATIPRPAANTFYRPGY